MAIVFAHPVLTSLTNDYPYSSFLLETSDPSNTGDDLNIIIRYKLSCDTLESLIEDKSAEFAVHVSTTWTHYSELFLTVQSKEDVLIIPTKELAGDISIVPYILAREDFDLNITSDHNEDYRDSNISKFSLAKGAILAVGDGSKVIGDHRTVGSIFDIISSESVPQGEFDLDYSMDRIQIKVNIDDRREIEKFRSSGKFGGYNVLAPSLFLCAVKGAILELEKEDGELQEWKKVLEKKIDEEDLDMGDLSNNALKYAQKLLESPLNKMINGFQLLEEKDSD